MQRSASYFASYFIFWLGCRNRMQPFLEIYYFFLRVRFFCPLAFWIRMQASCILFWILWCPASWLHPMLRCTAKLPSILEVPAKHSSTKSYGCYITLQPPEVVNRELVSLHPHCILGLSGSRKYQMLHPSCILQGPFFKTKNLDSIWPFFFPV